MRRFRQLGTTPHREIAVTLFVVLLLAVITHRFWFNLTSIFTWGDWYYWPDTALSQLAFGSGTWVPGYDIGSANIQVYFFPLRFLWAALAATGLSFSGISALTVNIPIAVLGFVAPYLFARRLTANSYIGMCVSFFYGSVTYFLIRQTSHLYVALAFAFAPLVLNQLLIAIDRNRTRDWVVLAMLFSVMACFELRIAYIFALVIGVFLLALCVPRLKQYWKNILLLLALFLGLSAFWLLPSLLGGIMEDVLAVANRGLFGDFWFDLQHAITISDPSWTGAYRDIHFIKQPVPLTAWIIPILALLAPLAVKKSRRLHAALFLLIAIVGILLTKQSTAPWPGLYRWLYESFPGFNLFREASKFYLLTALGYAGLLALGLEGSLAMLKGSRKKVFLGAAAALLLGLALINTAPLIIGSIGTMFVPRTVPPDYAELERFIGARDGFYRTLWVPIFSRWGEFSIEHPKVGIISANQTFWREYNDKSMASNPTKPQNIIAILKRPDARKVLSRSSIRYVVIPIKDLENDDNFYQWYGNSRQYFINEIRDLDYLEPVEIKARDLLVFENTRYMPHIYGAPLKFKEINPTKYRIEVKGLKKDARIRLNELYHAGWTLYGSSKNVSGGKRIGYQRSGVSEVIGRHEFAQAEDLGALRRKPAPGAKHIMTQDGQNEWTIDFDEIKKKWPKDWYQNNRDGSIDINLTIYFKAQTHFYIGLIISGLVLAGCLGYLGWEWKTIFLGRQSTA